MDLVNKYRPTKLSQVIGQDAAVKIMQGVLKRHEDINPVTLFCGPHSTGKTTLAWLLALYANCEQPDNGEACRKCSSCKNIIKAIREGRDALSVIEKPVSERGIDAIRQLQSQSEYRCASRYRWYILDEVHNLTPQAFDAALRLFEKPPKQTRFILCTTEPGKLPATIMSRNFIFSLQAIPPVVTARQLLAPICKREGFDLPKKILMQIASAVHGHPRDALNLLAQVVAAGEGGLNISEIPKTLERLEAALPYVTVRKYLTSVFAGRYGGAVGVMPYVTNPDYFIGQVIQNLQQVLYWWTDPQMVTPPYDRAIADIKPPDRSVAIRHIQDLGKMMTVCLDAQHRIKQYSNDGKAVLEAATIQMVAITHTWKK